MRGDSWTGCLDARAIDVWIFDLDNTLYPASSKLFTQVDHLIGRFIAEAFDLPFEAARRRQKEYFRQFGTTLRGLMTKHGTDPIRFLDYVHDIDLSAVRPNPVLEAALAALPGRKLIYTNGSASHAGRVMDRLGVRHHFEGVHDIVAAGYVPKPERSAYRELVEAYEFDPRRACMIEDMARNLVPAAGLGMTTVWLRSGDGPDWSRPDAATKRFIHHTIDDLSAWLGSLRSNDDD